MNDNQPYNHELWPTNKMLGRMAKRALSFLIIGIIMIVVANYFWDEHITYNYDWKGRYRAGGWPLWLNGLGIFLSAAGPIILLLFYVQTDRKNPAYGYNENGLFMNNMGWRKAFFKWDEIESLHDLEKGWGSGIEIRFKSLEQAINSRGGKTIGHLEQQHIHRKKSVTIDRDYVKGDHLGDFIKGMKGVYAKSAAFNETIQ